MEALCKEGNHRLPWVQRSAREHTVDFDFRRAAGMKPRTATVVKEKHERSRRGLNVRGV